MLNQKQLNDLEEKFNLLENDELLDLLIAKRQKYSLQAIEIADTIAKERGLEYEIPEFTEESVKSEIPWFVNVGFILLFAAIIGLEIYLSTIYQRNYSQIIGSLIRNIGIFYLGYRIVSPSKFSFIFLFLTTMALICGVFGYIIVTIFILALMYFLKYIVFNKLSNRRI